MAVLAESIKIRKRAAYVFGSEATVCKQIIRELKEKDWYVYEENLKDCSKDKIAKSVAKIQSIQPYLDMVVLGNDEELFNLDFMQKESNWNKAVEKYDQNINMNLTVIHFLLPLLDAGDMKRICYVNTRASSNNLCNDSKDYLDHIIGAARNMQAVMLKNRLQSEGYTFRIYSYDKDRQGKVSGSFAIDYFLQDRSVDPGSSQHSDEKRLVMRDEEGRELPW